MFAAEGALSRLSARNQLVGKVVAVRRGEVSTEIGIRDLRPAAGRLRRRGGAAGGHDARVSGSLTELAAASLTQADRVRVRVDARPQPSLVAEVTPAAVVELGLAEGSEVWVSVKATEVRAYPA